MGVLIDLFAEYPLETLLEAKDLRNWTTDRIRQAILDSGYSLAADGFKTARRRLSQVANRRFDEVSRKLRKDLLRGAYAFLAGKESYTRWTTEAKAALTRAYGEAFRLGYKSSGVGYAVQAAGPQVNPHEPTLQDLEQLESAVRSELRYLARMMRTIKGNSLAGTLENRVGAYSDALKHIYYAGRVAGTPKQMVIDWISPLDRSTCAGCRFLAEQSPYTRDILPTVPRSGSTQCLSRCRCRLVMREVSTEYLREVTRNRNSKAWYVRKLEALKNRR